MYVDHNIYIPEPVSMLLIKSEDMSVCGFQIHVPRTAYVYVNLVNVTATRIPRTAGGVDVQTGLGETIVNIYKPMSMVRYADL